MRQAGEPMMAKDVDRILSLANRETRANLKLVEQGWRSFLVRVENPLGLQQTVSIASDAVNPYAPVAIGDAELASRASLSAETHFFEQHRLLEPADIAKFWMGTKLVSKHPMNATLSGLGVEYQVLQIYSRDRGQKSAYLEANSAAAPWILTFGSKKGIRADFDCIPSKDIALDIKDWDGEGTVASLLIRDELGRLYPAITQRPEPDLDFQPQVYRADGESVRLPDKDSMFYVAA